MFNQFHRRATLLLVLLTMLGCFLSAHSPIVAASNNPGIPLYLHHLSGNVTVSGVQTSHVLNTTTLWNGAAESPNLRYNVYNFTLYPALTSALTSIGPGSISLWVTVAGAPGSFNATIYDANAGGQTAVVTTSQIISLNSSPNTPYRINLGFNINHTFSQSSTIKLTMTVFKISQLYVWYDSPNYPSALVIPVSGIPRLNLIETFDANFTARTSFSLNWTTPQRIVYLTIHVADPFGAYDVANATVVITGPGPTTVFTGVGSSLTTNPAAPEKLFEAAWAYNSNLANTTYTVTAVANDTSGDRDSNTVNAYLTSTSGPSQPSNPPPTQQPPPPTSNPLPLIDWLIAAGLISLFGLLLAFFLLTRRRSIRCPKCSSRVDSKLEKCPHCGSLLRPKAEESGGITATAPVASSSKQ